MGDVDMSGLTANNSNVPSSMFFATRKEIANHGNGSGSGSGSGNGHNLPTNQTTETDRVPKKPRTKKTLAPKRQTYAPPLGLRLCPRT